jgi:hypothetical protein
MNPPILNFPVVLCFAEGLKLVSPELTAHVKIAPLPFISDSNTDDVAVPVADKNPKKLDLKLEQNLLQKSALSYSG